MKHKSVFAATALIALALGLAGCAGGDPTGHMDGSRVELYDSVRGIAADASLIAVGEVTEQEVVQEDIPYTLSTFAIEREFSPAVLGRDVPAGAPKIEGSEVVVRQMGAAGTELPYPILEPGQRYLLFLSPSMLEGEKATQLYITGGSAGIYSIEGNAFVHGPFTEGDTLPGKLTANDLQN
ncbi:MULTISPECIES: hypothetical protein [Microbacterium]|uniref:Lipoprotein n=1 Tax=Microbacterium kyungheense TaxID=1263636 RepID=A0A543F0L3_9MICO|nr:hypothetical protein [Microbacterium kyungheense]TQM27374.1 hypothetical protein FB391_1387 [Microbacterium kyungheense]